MEYLSTGLGSLIFNSIAEDEQILFAHTRGACFVRREAMIGRALEKGIPIEHIERALFIVSDGSFMIPEAESLIYSRSDGYVKKVVWTWHSSMLVSLYDETKKEVVKRIFDPSINPLEMLTENQWTDYMRTRTEPDNDKVDRSKILVPQFDMITSPIGKLPEIDPEKNKPHRQISELMKNVRLKNNTVLEFMCGGMFVNPEMDWNKLTESQRKSTFSFLANWMRRDAFNIQMQNDEEYDDIRVDNVGRNYVNNFRIANGYRERR